MAFKNKFRFETVHRVRKLQEKAKMRELGQLMSELRSSINYRKNLLGEKFGRAKELSSITAKAHQVAVAQVTFARMEFLEDQIIKADALIEDVKALIEQKRVEVSDAYRSRKMFDKLLVKHDQRVTIFERRTEEKELNEISIVRFSKNNNFGTRSKEVDG